MLTDCEKKAIQDGWNKATPSEEAKVHLGKDIFNALFDQYPQHKDMFPSFRGKSGKELNDSDGFKSHAKRVVDAIDSAIQNLDDQASTAKALESLSASHKERKVTGSHFDDLNKVLVEVLENKLGKDFVDNKEAWLKLLKGIISSIQKGL